MSAVRRSVLFSAGEKYVTQALTIATTMVMARLLTPAETGLYLTTWAVVMLADSFRDFGVGNYIVQAKMLDRREVRTAFTITLALSLATALAISFGSGAIARFYGDPALVPLLTLASLAFIVTPFGTTVSALLRRDLAFRALAGVNVAAAALNAAATISLGLLGYGAASFLWAYVLSNGVAVILMIAARPDLWAFRPCLARWRPLLSFGTVSTGVAVVNVAYDVLPRLALGKILGFGATGLYGRAIGVCQLPDRMLVSALQPVVLPAMAAHSRAGRSLKQAYLQGHRIVSAFQWPALAILALLADPVVRLLLGAQWMEAVPLVRVMALATMALAPAFMTYPVLVATGRVPDALRASLISLPPSIGLLLLAAPHGVLAVAASLLVVAPLQMAVALAFIRRAIGLRWRDLGAASWQSAIMTLAASVAPALAVLLSPGGFDPGWGITAIAVAGAGAGWLAAAAVTGHPVCAEALAGWRTLVRRTVPAE